METSPGPRRGRPPRYDRDAVVAAGVALADAEGLAAVTMRAVAGRLGAGVMSLYSYVPDKPALVQAMVEQVSAELALPVLTGDWRADLAASARAQRAMMLRHPWLIEALTHRQPPGPGTLAYLEHVLAALEPTGLPGGEGLLVASLLTGFVLNAVRGELADGAAAADAAAADAAAAGAGPPSGAEQARALEALLASGRYPRLVALVAADPGPEPPRTISDLFDELLDRTIDGLVRPAARRPP